MFSFSTALKGLKFAGITLGALLVIAVVVRIPHVLEVQKTKLQVAKIHATKLTIDDVMGKNLPPEPGTEADKTIVGIDANKNGIRDDVELAIFKEYPDSAKTRAALLQYALALQLGALQPILNKDVVTAVVEIESKGDGCLADGLVPRKTPESSRSSLEMSKINSYTNFVKERQLNTEQRKKYRSTFYDHLGSYSLDDSSCDVSLIDLLN